MSDVNKSGPITEIWKSLKRMAGGLWELTELQVQLLKLDSTRTIQQSIFPLVILALGGLAILTSVPLILWGVVHGLTELLEWPLWQSLLLVGATALALGLGFLVLATGKLRKCCQPMRRSLAELKRNANWIKNTFTDFET